MLLELLFYVWTARPDPVLTPGVTNPQCTTEMICPHVRNPRHVPQRIKNMVLKNYNMVEFCHQHKCEIDHLIPLELCGSNDIRNLWAQPPPDWQHKDIFEDMYHRAVCGGQMTLQQAQDEILHFYDTHDNVYYFDGDSWRKIISAHSEDTDVP